MGDGYEIKVSGATFIDETMKFQIRTQTNWRDNLGVVDNIEFFITIVAEVVRGTPEEVADRTVALSEQVSDVLIPVDVQVLLDGVVKWDFKKSESIGSPQIRLFETLEEDGNGDSHWRYRMEIYVKRLITAGTDTGDQENVTEFETELIVVKEREKTIQKIWKAMAVSDTIENAKALVFSFKPSETNIREETSQQFKQNRYSAIWVWDSRATKEIIEIDEDPMVITGFGNGVVVVKQVEPSEAFVGPQQAGAAGVGIATGPGPTFHKARRGAATIRITGRIFGYEAAAMIAKIPGPHFPGTGEMVRIQPSEKITPEPSVFDKDKGILVLPYEEVYLFSGTVVPAANHAGHAEPTFLEPPPDGPIVGS